jgi:hypothetical protein
MRCHCAFRESVVLVLLAVLSLPSTALAQAKMTLEIAPEQSTEFPVAFNAVFTNREGKELSYWSPWGLDCPSPRMFLATLEYPDMVRRQVQVFNPNCASGSGKIMRIGPGQTRRFPFLLTQVAEDELCLFWSCLIREAHWRFPPGEYKLTLSCKGKGKKRGKRISLEHNLFDGESEEVRFKVLVSRALCEQRKEDLQNPKVFPEYMREAFAWCIVTDGKFEEWMRTLESSNGDEVLEAARMIDRCTCVEEERLDKIVRCLMRGLEDPERVEESSQRAEVAIHFLRRSESIAASKALMHLATAQFAERVRLEAVGDLRGRHHPEVDTCLERLVLSESPEVAFKAACVLADRGNPKGLDLLARHARNSGSPWRWEAVEALCDLGKVPEARSILQGLRDDWNWDLRDMVRKALAEEGSGFGPGK